MDYKKFDEEVSEFIKGKSLACEKNCSDCCKNVPLLISYPEIDYIVEELNKLNNVQKKNIAKNIKQLDKKYTVPAEQIKSMEDIQNSRAMQMNYRCPFLLGDSCSIYNARPMLCRGYMSTDKSLCKNGTGDLAFKRSDSLMKHYIDINPYKVNNSQLQSHAHRSIEFKNGKFYSLTKAGLEKAKRLQ
jgi:Fe-S-cluster containining protein